MKSETLHAFFYLWRSLKQLMKNLLTLIFIVLLVGTLCAQEKPQPKQQNIAFADIDYILSALPEAKQLEEELNATRTRLQGDLEKKQKAFQELYASYQANAATMADTVRQKSENQLRTLNAELQQFPEEAQKTLENTRSLRMAPVYLKVGKAIEAVAMANGFSLIIPRALSGYDVILFADERKNVSDLVLQQLGVPGSSEKK